MSRRTATPIDTPPAAPLVRFPMRDAEPDEIPRSAKILLRRLGVGWRQHVTYGQGMCTVGRRDKDAHKIVKEVRPCTSIAVRLRHDARSIGVVACFVDGSYDAGWIWAVCADPDCTYPRRDHPALMPVMVEYRELVDFVTDDTAAIETTTAAIEAKRAATASRGAVAA
jgi:hypothetical protein